MHRYQLHVLLVLIDAVVRRWHAAYRKKGRKGLAATHNTGRPPRLDAKARNQFEQALLEGAHAAGFPNDLWTCPRVPHLRAAHR